MAKHRHHSVASLVATYLGRNAAKTPETQKGKHWLTLPYHPSLERIGLSGQLRTAEASLQRFQSFGVEGKIGLSFTRAAQHFREFMMQITYSKINEVGDGGLFFCF